MELDFIKHQVGPWPGSSFVVESLEAIYRMCANRFNNDLKTIQILSYNKQSFKFDKKENILFDQISPKYKFSAFYK